MSLASIEKVTVIGGGIMGRQIALNAAQHQFSVALTDTDASVLEKAEQWAGEYLSTQVKKGRMTSEEAKAVLQRLTYVPELSQALAGCDLVIEAIVEKEDVKRKLFISVDHLISGGAIIATNSSYIPSSVYCNDISHPERLINLHYFNPAMKMELAEIVAGPHTSPLLVEALQPCAKKITK